MSGLTLQSNLRTNVRPRRLVKKSDTFRLDTAPLQHIDFHPQGQHFTSDTDNKTMGALTSSHILAKLVAAGNNAAPQSIILEFPNMVSGTDALAGGQPFGGSLQEKGGTSVVFSQGKINIAASSVSDKTDDVSTVAPCVEHPRGETSFKKRLSHKSSKAGRSERLIKAALKVEMDQTTLSECLPEREITGWQAHRPAGEISHEDDTCLSLA